jgi:hypothetical protein
MAHQAIAANFAHLAPSKLPKTVTNTTIGNGQAKNTRRFSSFGVDQKWQAAADFVNRCKLGVRKVTVANALGLANQRQPIENNTEKSGETVLCTLRHPRRHAESSFWPSWHAECIGGCVGKN